MIFPQPGEVWRHYKGGEYVIFHFARDENGRLVIVYGKPGKMFVQGIDRFMEEVEHDKPRFRYAGLEEKSDD